MSKIKTFAVMLIMVAVVATFGGMSLAGSDKADKPINSACPMSGKDVNPSKTTAYTVSFCCGNCKGKFDKNPAKYLGKVAESDEGKCPMSGKSVNPEKTSTVVIGFCCGNCKGKFEKAPKKHIGKVKAKSS